MTVPHREGDKMCIAERCREATELKEDDYREYEDFWLKCNPGCSDAGWLKEKVISITL